VQTCTAASYFATSQAFQTVWLAIFMMPSRVNGSFFMIASASDHSFVANTMTPLPSAVGPLETTLPDFINGTMYAMCSS